MKVSPFQCLTLSGLLGVCLIATMGSAAFGAPADSKGSGQPAANAGKAVLWKGYTQTRMYMDEGGPTQLRLERTSVSATYKASSINSFYIEGYWQPTLPDLPVYDKYKVYLESMFWDCKAGPGTLRFGKGRRQTFGVTPSYPNRKLSNYGITAETFTQSRVQGLQYFGVMKEFDFGVGVLTGLHPGTTTSGDLTLASSKRLGSLGDKDIPTELSNHPEYSFRAGFKKPSGLRYGVTALTSRLDSEDLTFIRSKFPGIHNDQTRNRYGAYVQAPIAPWYFLGEYYEARTSDVGHNGLALTLGYEPKNKKAMRCYARYDQVNYEGDAIASSQFTWDKSQISFSIVKPIDAKTWLQLEFEGNMEKVPAGGTGAHNDVAFLELFKAF
ncbi:MAG: hypothetical protein WCL39_00120 [Armatimonadota bacterium]